MTLHQYTSAKGENFLTCHQWAEINLSEEEYEIYINEDMTPEKEAIFARWTAEEQITSHIVFENGVQVTVHAIE
jgi:hypothetical protein